MLLSKDEIISRLVAKVETVAPVSNAFLEELYLKTEIVCLKKNETLINYGTIPDSGFFIASGSLRSRLLLENGDFKTVWFYFDELFYVIAFLESYQLKQPSDCEITAMEECCLLKISFNDVRCWIDFFPEFGKFTREDMEKHFAIISQIRRYMTALKKKDFVEFLSSNYPIILNKVSNKLVADFVGITPEWFCKLKKSHTRNNRICN